MCKGVAFTGLVEPVEFEATQLNVGLFMCVTPLPYVSVRLFAKGAAISEPFRFGTNTISMLVFEGILNPLFSTSSSRFQFKSGITPSVGTRKFVVRFP